MKFNKSKVEQAIYMLLEGMGYDVEHDENLKKTPYRCAEMYQDILAGQDIDIKKYLTFFPAKSDDMVIIRNVPFYSYCSHHLQPFFGKLTIAYIPDGKVLGLSKLVRIARTFAKRLQIQEDLTFQIAEFLEKNIPNKGVAVSIRAQHFCCIIRGVRAVGMEAVTTHLSGLFKEDDKTRNEFLRNLSDKEGYA